MVCTTRVWWRQGLSALEDRRVLSLMLLMVTFACAQVRFHLPFTEVPLSGQTFAVLLTGMMVGAGWGAATQAAYVGLGTAGLPLFAGWASGWSALAGPTGGYLVGFVVCAWTVGALARIRPSSFSWLLLCGVVGSVVIYVLGAGWYSVATRQGLFPTFLKAVAPFLPGDGAKLILAATVASGYQRLRRSRGRMPETGEAKTSG